MSEPQTEAGRALLEDWTEPHEVEVFRRMVLAIEQQAAAAERARLLTSDSGDGPRLLADERRSVAALYGYEAGVRDERARWEALYEALRLAAQTYRNRTTAANLRALDALIYADEVALLAEPAPEEAG